MPPHSLNVGIAFAAGIVSFISPCILPLIPSYVSLLGGTTIKGLTEEAALRRAAVINTLFFIGGFTAIFILLGALFSAAFGLFAAGIIEYINIAAGIIVIILGLNFIFDFWKFLNFEKRIHLQGKPTSRVGSLLFGMAFGAGWTPCIGPILGSILLLAGASGSLVQGVALLFVYSLGLGVPFLITGFFLSQALAQLTRLKRHLKTIKIASGIFLIIIGYLIFAGRLKEFNGFLFSLSSELGTWQHGHPFRAQLLFGIIFLVPVVLIAIFYLRRVRRDLRDASSPGPGDPPASRQARERVAVVRPVRLAFLALFFALSLLSFVGLVNLSYIVSLWLGFQGI
ncbi:MAG TPA: cytochrome c biogenesis protein CcdA [Spirochaetia bacterium]|nr:cytochrome c biogenesis protein CcdA [Spirochaetia bacterium]